jgi:chaperonin GroES
MSDVTIRPLQDRVLVEAAAAKEKPQRGRIVAVGNGKVDEPLTVKVGDEVLYGKYAGTEISFNNKEYLIMRESDIFAIL